MLPQLERSDSPPWRETLLAEANGVRLARGRLKRSMSVSELLMSQKRWGGSRCRPMLVRVRVPMTKQIGTLTARQQETLVEALWPSTHGELAA